MTKNSKAKKVKIGEKCKTSKNCINNNCVNNICTRKPRKKNAKKVKIGEKCKTSKNCINNNCVNNICTRKPRKKNVKPQTISRTNSPPRIQNVSLRARDPNYIGKKNEVDYLAEKLNYKEMKENVSISFDTIISRLSEAERVKWESMNLQESDVVWEYVDEDIMYCGRATFLVFKKRNKLHLMIFPMCCQNLNKLKDENGKKNEGEDENGRYDFGEGDCIDNGYMIHPKSYRIIKVF